MFEDDVMLTNKSAVSEDSVTELLEILKSTKEKPSVEEIFNFLKTQNAQRYFKYNINQYCELHALVIAELNEPTVFVEFLKNENTFQKIFIERDDFHNSFFEILFLPLLNTSRGFCKDELVFNETSKIIQKCLFNRNFKQFERFLNELVEKQKSSEKSLLCKALFKFIPTLYSLEPDLCSHAFKLIFHSFCNAYNNFGLSYKMLVILIEMIGFDLKDEFALSKIKYQIYNASLEQSLPILNDLFGVTASLKIELDYELNDVTFTNFVTRLLKSLIALTGVTNDYCYQIFMNVAEINPLIIESLTSEILVYIMLGDNGECREKYEAFMIKIFEVFSKLHRIQNLISKMIPTLKSGLENDTLNETVYKFKGNVNVKRRIDGEYIIENILPKSVLSYFTNCIINLASWQIINLFKTLLYHLNKTIEELPDFKGENSELIFVEILSTLTCWVLLSVRMAEHTVAASTVAKFIGCLEELRTVLGKFGVALLHKEHNHILMRAFLNIAYHWAEIYITMEYYSVSKNIKMEKTVDNNFSPSNLTYLHSYLSCKEWCLISERITNFGEKPCKQIMQKLVIQKLRAVLIFESDNQDMIGPIIKSLATDFQSDSVEIFTDRFMVNNILQTMPSHVLVRLSEDILQNLFDNTAESHIYDSQLITRSILCVISSKIYKIYKSLKQKRKLDEMTIKKPLSLRILSSLPSDAFLRNNIEEFFATATDILATEDEELFIDLKPHEDEIEKYFDALKKLPVIFCEENPQKLLILLLLSLHRDILRSNCSSNLRTSCESLIISIVQHSKFDLLDLFEANNLLKVIIDKFERSEDLFTFIAGSIFKSDTAIGKFELGIKYIKDNLKESRYLKLAVIVLNLLNKIKKTKISVENKNLCMEYKSAISSKIVKLISKRSPEDHLIEPYALVLKTFLAKDEDNLLSKLTSCLNDYAEFSLCSLNEENLKGSLLLFITLLHNKKALTDLSDDIVFKIWDTLKTVNIRNENLDEYSQLVTLIASLIPNEQFSNIFQDLLQVTENSIDRQDYKEFSKHLKTWTCIISTNFNPIKTNILREQLEFLLEKLILMLKCVEYQENLFEEVIQFKVSIIQTNHVPLTSAIVDFFLMVVTILITKKSGDFIPVFNLCVHLMETLLKYRNPLIMDRLPPYLLQYRMLLKELCSNSKASLVSVPSEVQKVADCAHKMEKLTRSVTECTKDMSRISMYLVADILGQYELDTLNPHVKKHLDNCIYSLISLCDQHAVQYLMRVLSNASTEIFKVMYENYKKYYRFTGKI